MRTHIDGMPEQICEALDDGQSKPQPFATLPRRVFKLVKLLEDRLKLKFRDAGTRITNLNTQHVTTSPTAQQYPSLAGVFDRVRYQISDDLFQQPRIAANRQTATTMIVLAGLLLLM